MRAAAFIESLLIAALFAGSVGGDVSAIGQAHTSQIAGKWESFFLQVVPNPLARVSMALFVKAGKYQQGEPSVKHRGIFLNDEAPELSGWVTERFGTVPLSTDPPIPANVANYNSKFYARIFEVILRLKGNYLWPAMWNNAFNEDDADNARLADEYGVVMGTSHQKPMLRAQKEWEESVKDACRVVRSTHTLSNAGYHTLKVWMVDPAVVLQKIMVDLGGLGPSYLGPPESYRHGKSISRGAGF